LEAYEAKHAHDESREEYSGTVERFVIIVNDKRKDDHGEHIANHGADGTPCGKRSSVCGFIGNKGEQGAVGNVCDCVESVPDNVAGDEDDYLRPCGSTGERKEATSSAYDKANGTEPNVSEEFVSLIFASVRVNDGTDKGVVDSVPYLNHYEQQRVPKAQAHYLCPEKRHRTLERKAHVAAKVAGSVRNAVPNTKLAFAVGIKLFFFFHPIVLFLIRFLMDKNISYNILSIFVDIIIIYF
jgi:hypothetical protein